MKGMMTLDFIFSLLIAFGMTVILFSMSFTLSVVEMTQYIVFATSRAHLAGHINQESQIQAGIEKYKELTTHKVLAPFYKNGWFQISKPEQIEVRGAGKMGQTFTDEYSGTEKLPFIGVRIDFESKILNVQLPFIGSGESDSGYKTKITGFMSREPTMEECTDFYAKRFDVIQKQDSRYSTLLNMKSSDYIPVEDNGC